MQLINFFLLLGRQWWLGNVALGDCTKSSREWLPICVFSVSAREPQQWQNHSPVTTLWNFVPSTQDMTVNTARIHPTLHHTSTWGWGWTENKSEGRKSFPAGMPLDGSRDGPICQQFAWEKQEMISTFRFHQWRREMFQHIWAKQPSAAVGRKNIAAAWVWEGVQGFATRSPGWSCLAVWINGSRPDNMEEEWG